MSAEVRVVIADEGADQSAQAPARQTPLDTMTAEQREFISKYMQQEGRPPLSQTHDIQPKQSPSATHDVQTEAERRLKKLADDEAVEKEMRAMSDEYRRRQEQREQEKQERQQDRDEDFAARQEVREERRREREEERLAARQERDEERRIRQEESEARRREREEKQERHEAATTLAMAGSAIGGTAGRAMGVVSLVMKSPELMAMFDRQAPNQQQQRTTGGPPRAGGNVPVGELVNPGAAGAQGAGAAGGAMSGLAAAAPVVGAAMAVGQMIKQGLDDMAESRRQTVRQGIEFSRSVVSMDVDKRAEFFTSSVERMAQKAADVSPVLGTLTKPAAEFVRGVNEMRQEVKSTAEHLAQYDGRLAAQVALQDVDILLRDIERARRFGENVERTNASRHNMEQRLQDLMDRFTPFVMTMLEKIFNSVERAISTIDNGTVMLLRSVDGVLALAQRGLNLFGDVPIVSNAIREIRDLIARALPDAEAATADAHLRAFMQAADMVGMPSITPMAPRPGPALRPS